MNNTLSKQADLLWSFFKIGFFTFGGGLAMIPFIENEFVEKKKWLTGAEMTEMIALSQSFPGVIAVNVSILVGHHVARKTGAVCAAVGTVLPALLSIVLILTILQGFENNPWVLMVFVGIKAASAALILDTVVRLIKKTLHKNLDWVIAAIALGIVMLNFSAAWSVVVGAIGGIAFYNKRRQEGKQ